MLRRLTYLVAIACLFLPLTSEAETFKEVRSHAFHLIDEHGKTKASLSFSKDGLPVLAFLDKNGKPFAYFTGNKFGSSLRLFDKKHRCKVNISVNKNNIPMFFILDDFGKPKLLISSKNNSGAYIIICDKTSKPRLVIDADKKQPHIYLLDKNNLPRVVLFYDVERQGLAIRSKNIDSNLLMGILHGKPAVLLNRAGGKGVMLGYSRRDQPFVAVRHEDGIKWIRPRVDASDLPGLPQQLLELQDHLRAIGGR